MIRFGKKERTKAKRRKQKPKSKNGGNRSSKKKSAAVRAQREQMRMSDYVDFHTGDIK